LKGWRESEGSGEQLKEVIDAGKSPEEAFPIVQGALGIEAGAGLLGDDGEPSSSLVLVGQHLGNRPQRGQALSRIAHRSLLHPSGKIRLQALQQAVHRTRGCLVDLHRHGDAS
jgi:hypothetical protein